MCPNILYAVAVCVYARIPHTAYISFRKPDRIQHTAYISFQKRAIILYPESTTTTTANSICGIIHPA